MGLGFRTVLAASSALAAVALLAGSQPAAAQPKDATAPQYRYDPTWPKASADHKPITTVVGLFVDPHDNVWVLSRPSGPGDTSPLVTEISPNGDVLRAWGGPGYVPGWPVEEHTILLDKQGNVWLAGAGAGDTLLKFTPDGKLLRDFGNRGPLFKGRAVEMTENNQETALLLRGVASAAFDEPAHEVYISDGYLNKRVMVYDLDTGAFKRGWGAYGKPLAQIDDMKPAPIKPNEAPRKDFTPSVHCVVFDKSGLLYVCDRGGDRVQVFDKQGKFQREILVAPETPDKGSVGSVSFSPDAAQRFMFVSDIQNNTMWIVERESGRTVGHFGQHGDKAGDFSALHLAASDSHGAIYAGDVGAGGKLQKFVPAVAGK